MVEVLREIESASNMIFNFDPNALQEFSFSGSLDIDDINTSLDAALISTPFHWEQTTNAILIYEQQPTEYRICGYIMDHENGVSLQYANIVLGEGKAGTQSNASGYFELNVSAQKHEQLTVSYVGFEDVITYLGNINTDTCVHIKLHIDKDLLGTEIVITDYLIQGIKEGEHYSSLHFDYHQLKDFNTNIEQDVLRSAQLLPGITSLDESATNLQIRGGTSDQNLILWEGVRLYDPGHFFGMISAVNPFVIHDVDVYKSAFDPGYDNIVGGVIDMSLRDTVTSRFHGGVGTTLTEAHAYVEVPVVKDKLMILASGRKTLYSLWDSPTLASYTAKVFQDSKVTDLEDEDGGQELDYHDWNAKIIYQPSDRLKFIASYLSSGNMYNFDVIDFEDELNSTDNVEVKSSALNVSTEFMWSSKFRSELSFTRSSYENNYFLGVMEIDDDEDEEEDISTQNVFNAINDVNVSLKSQYLINPGLDLSLGYEFNQKGVDLSLQYTSDFEVDFQDEQSTEGQFHNLFGALTYQTNKVLIDGGIRVTHYNIHDIWTASPRLGIQYAITQAFKLKASGGVLQQFISQLSDFGDTDLGISNPVWVLNNVDSGIRSQQFQQSQKGAAGFILHKNGWLLDVEGYYNRTTGLNTINPLFAPDLNVPEFEFGESIAKGVDVLLKKNWGVFHGWINYSISEVDFLFPEIADDRFPASNDHRHNLNIMGSVNLGNWSLSLSYQYRTGLRYSEPSGIESDGAMNYSIQYDEYNMSRLPDYHRVDLGLSYKTTLKSGHGIELGVSVINLLDHDNYLSRSFFLGDFDDDEVPEVFAIDKFFLGTTPQALVRYTW